MPTKRTTLTPFDFPEDSTSVDIDRIRDSMRLRVLSVGQPAPADSLERFMEHASRRRFLATTSSAALAAALVHPRRFAGAFASENSVSENPVSGNPAERSSTKPPHLYELRKIPRVDIHVHIKSPQLEMAGKFIETMDAGKVTVSVILSGTREVKGPVRQRRYLEQVDAMREQWKGRILFCPRDSDPSDGLWWSEDDLAEFKERRYPGTKIWAKYRQGVLAPEFVKKVQRQGELDLPVLGFHIADPPEGKYLQSNYWDCIREAEQLIHRCPETTFIMAHGFWLMLEDRGLDLLANYFDRNSNLNVDLGAVYQWWDPPNPSYKKLRDFMITYKDRLLFGSDGNPDYTTPEKLRRIYHILESADENLVGFFREETNLRGLDLPLDVLNHIYYWNAARLVPEVRRSLEQHGYTVS